MKSGAQYPREQGESGGVGGVCWAYGVEWYVSLWLEKNDAACGAS